MSNAQSPDNPLLQQWATPYGLPPFDLITPELFEPAFNVALAAHLAELDTIAAQAAAPDFDNTLAAFDRAGRQLKQIDLLLNNLAASETSPALQAVELRMAPRIAAHCNAIYMHSRLFARIDALHRERAALGLQGEQLRLLERLHLDFVRAGARLAPAQAKEYGEVMEKLADLTTRFSQNVLADEAGFALVLTGEADLAGLPAFLREATRAAAEARGMAPGSHLVQLSMSVVVPFLTFSARRDLREQVYTAWAQRGAQTGAHDNRPLITAIMQLRERQAQLHGYATFADYALVDRMAGTPAAVAQLLEQVWEPAKAAAVADRALLQEIAADEGCTAPIAAWDWRYYAEKVRAARYDLDDNLLKPYFTLDNMISAMFDCATRLFGVRFAEQQGIPLYHADVRLWEVRNRDDKLIGIFLGDNYARTSKQGGAWMSIYRSQSRLAGEVLPIVVNNNNFAKGSPTLLGFEDVRTLFHEFGHGLHGLLSDVTYERLAGTQVLKDYVELPSQLFEHWALEDEVLKRHARHHETGEAIPDALLEKLRAARRFNQAYETVQYVGPALIDMALHARPHQADLDVSAFEAAECTRLGVPGDIGLRHRLTHFRHLFSGDSYAAGYYVYMWAEVLDADGYAAFMEAGDPFDPAVAARLYQYVYSSGNSQDVASAYRAFRGRDARVDAMLEKRGLLVAT